MTKITGVYSWLLIINVDYFQENFATFAGTFLPQNCYWRITLHICGQQLRPISNAWDNSKLCPFWENFKNLNLPAFIKEGMVSIMLYLFEKLCLHGKLVIYTMNIFHKSWKYTNFLRNT